MEEEIDIEEQVYCNNCKKKVGASNFASHSAFCQRHLLVCNICDEPVPRKKVAEHDEEYHVMVKCELCSFSVEKWKLPQHQKVCPKRRIICEFCEGDFAHDQYIDHIKFCSSRTEKCTMCSKYIQLKDMKEHKEFHMYEINAEKEEIEKRQNLRNEFKSKASGKEPEYNYSLSGSSEKNNYKTPDDFDYGSMIGATASVPEKSKQVISQKSPPVKDGYTRCHLCRENVLWTDYNQHITSCTAYFENCPYCGENVPKFHFEEHCSSCAKTKTPWSDLKASENKSSSHKIYPQDDNYSRKQTVLPGFTTCSFCGQQHPRSELPEHFKFCPEFYVDCQLCCEKVPYKDINEHMSAKCKMLQENMPSDVYECPLCCEKVLEKDKVSHESFGCKHLLDASEDSLYSLQDERKLKQSREGAQKNSTDICMQCMKNIPKHELSNHKKFDCKNSENQCPYCDKKLLSMSKEHHLRICEVYRDICKINGSENEYEQKRANNQRECREKGAKPKYPKVSSFEIPEVAKCKFCKTTLNSNILLYHEKECVHQQVKCPDCSFTTILKDIYLHRCKPTKRRGTGRGDTKKPEKPEQGSHIWSKITNFLNPEPKVKTYVDHQNERNEFYDNNMGYYREVQHDREETYFSPPIQDDPKLPCEFCEQLFPASEIVLHTTQCNPDETSLCKQTAHKKANEASIQTKQSKETFFSITASSNVFPSDDQKRFLPSTKYESIHDRVKQKYNSEESVIKYEKEPKRLGQNLSDEDRINDERLVSPARYPNTYRQKSDDEKRVGAERILSSIESKNAPLRQKFDHEKKTNAQRISSSPRYENKYKHFGSEAEPGEFLESHYSKSDSYSDHKTRVKQSHSSSAFKSVWNDDDTSDVEMEEVQPETNSSNLSEKLLKDKEKNVQSSFRNEKTSSNSEEEMEEMLQFIKNEKMKIKQGLEENSTVVTVKHNIHLSEDDSSLKSNADAHFDTKQCDSTKEHMTGMNSIEADKKRDAKEDQFERTYGHVLSGIQEMSPSERTLQQPIVDSSRNSDKSDYHSNYHFDVESAQANASRRFQQKISKNDSVPESEKDVIRRVKKKDFDTACDDADQNSSLSDKQKRGQKMFKFKEILNRKIDMHKVNLEVVKPWISKCISDMLGGIENDDVVESVFNQLEGEQYPDGRIIQISLTRFLDEKTARDFMAELWALLIDTENTADGIPTAILEQQKDELNKRMTHKSKFEQEKENILLSSQKEDALLVNQKERDESSTPSASSSFPVKIEESTSDDQDNKFNDNQKQLKYSEILARKVDVNKINLKIVKSWIAKRIIDIVGESEYSFIVDYVLDQLESEQYPDGRIIQISLARFMNERNAREFMVDLWALLISAENSANGIPSSILEQQKDEFKKRRTSESKSEHQKEGALLKNEKESGSLVNQKERDESNTESVSSFFIVKNEEALEYEQPQSIPSSQKEKRESKIRDVPSSISVKSEISRTRNECDSDTNIHPIQNSSSENRTFSASYSPEQKMYSVEMFKKYGYQSDRLKSREEETESRLKDVSSTVPMKQNEVSRSKHDHEDDADTHSNQNVLKKYQYSSDDSTKNKKEETESRFQHVSSSMSGKENEKSKYFTTCPICKETIKWIDYNIHVPTCATVSNKCSRCGKQIPSSEIKKHFLYKCPAISKKAEPEIDRNVSSRMSGKSETDKNSSSRISGYDSVFQSITSGTNVDETRISKSSYTLTSERIKTPGNATKMHTTDLDQNDKRYTNQKAFTVEPDEKYMHYSRSSDKRSFYNLGESKKENEEKRIPESSESNYPGGVNVDIWSRWSDKTNDE